MARAFAGDYSVSDFYQRALGQIGGILNDLPNEGQFKNLGDEQLVNHFLRQAIGSSQEGGWELHPLQEVDPPHSRSLDYDEQPSGYFPVGGGAIYVRETEGYFRVPSAGAPPLVATPTSLGNSRYRIREYMASGGTMIVLVLPQGCTVVDPSPLPIETKVFNTCVTLFWRKVENGQSLEVTLTLRSMTRELQEEVEQLNSRSAQLVTPEAVKAGNIVIERPGTDSKQLSSPVTIFHSYSHQDEQHRMKLQTHLSPLRNEGLIAEWHDRKILPGTQWKDEIDENLANAQIILLLVSPDFLASSFCYDQEMARALTRHEEGSALVIPIILRSVDWHSAPIGRLLALPRDGKPITTWRTAWTDVAKGIRRAVEQFASRA